MLQSVSVSNLDIFRAWKSDEDLDIGWLIARLRGTERTPAMILGEAFHKAIENAKEGEVVTLVSGQYRFDMNCAAEIVLPSLAEASVQKQYGDLTVRGRVDAIVGKEVVDYKSTTQFDPDRLMSGFQWRLYLDLTECDSFCWKVFVLREFGGDPDCYEIREVHTLRQNRYPDLHADCERLAEEYLEFADTYLTEIQPVARVAIF